MLKDTSDPEVPLLVGDEADENGIRQSSVNSDSNDPIFGYLPKSDDSSGCWTRKRILIASAIFVVLLMFPVTFLSIIPSEVSSECKDTQISIVEAHISNPTNEGFDSDVTMQFSKGSPIPHTTIKMHDTYIKWDGNGDGRSRMVKLSHTHKLQAITGHQQLKSKATVVDLELLTNFNEYSVDAGQILWEMQGSATVQTLIDVDVDIDKSVTMEGYNSFSIPPVVQDVTVTGGSPTELYSISNTVIKSQSNMALHFGQDLNFLIKSRGTTIGVATIPDATLYTGEFTSTSNVVMKWGTQQEYDELMTVLGQFMMGNPSEITMENFYLTNPVTWLEPGLNSIKMSSALPGVSDSLVVQINMYVSIRHIVNVPFDLHLFNPIDSEVEMQDVTCKIYYDNEHIADVDEDKIGLKIPPKSMVVSPTFTARVDFKHTGTVLDLLQAGFGYLDLYCSMKTLVEQFPVEAVYDQMQVPAYLEEA